MPDINFNCPECDQNIDAPEDMAGAEVECPSCGTLIRIPGGASPEPEAVVEEDSDIDKQKSSTLRLEIPEDLKVPKPKRRVITIKRPK